MKGESVEQTETNGINEPAVYVQLVDDDPPLARELSNEITRVDRARLEDAAGVGIGEKRKRPEQSYEVAMAYLARGRSLARVGKDELARRQLAAAKRVLGEVVDE